MEKVNRKIWITGIWGYPILNAVSGLAADEDVEIIADDFALKEPLRKVYRMINRKLGGRGSNILQNFLETSVLDKFYKLTKCDFKESNQNFIILFNSALVNYYSKGYLERLKSRNPNIKIILYIIDPMPNGVWERITRMQDAFDKILTAHLWNKKQYGFTYFPYIYTPPQITPIREQSRQIYFVGVTDDYRYEMIMRIRAACQEHGVSYEMYFFKGENYERIEDTDVHYGLIPYDENVARAVHDNCILEIVRENFIGFTQRYYEAVVFNKKLLTNNKEIKELPYYDARYMQYFSRVEDIDWEWVKEEVEIDYHYQGDFAPERWKQKLLTIIEGGG